MERRTITCKGHDELEGASRATSAFLLLIMILIWKPEAPSVAGDSRFPDDDADLDDPNIDCAYSDIWACSNGISLVKSWQNSSSIVVTILVQVLLKS